MDFLWSKPSRPLSGAWRTSWVGNNGEAAKWARQAVSHHPEFTFGLRTLATSLAQAGQTEQARKVLVRATALEPDFTLAGGRRVLLTAVPTFAERYMDGRRKAGLS